LKVAEIRAFNDEELMKKFEESRRELFDLRFKLATKQLVNHRELPRVRKDVACLKTVMRERELKIR
jgi:large subunit ribosomal protein L29